MRFRLDKYIAGLCFNRTAFPVQKSGLKSSAFRPKAFPQISPKSYRHRLYLKPFLIAIFNFSHKRLMFALTPESGYTLGSLRKIAHSGLHGETGGLLSAVTALSCAAREIVPKEQPEEADARLRRVSASSGVAALPGCVTLFVIWQCCCFSLCAQEFLHAQGEGVSLPSAYSACY